MGTEFIFIWVVTYSLSPKWRVSSVYLQKKRLYLQIGRFLNIGNTETNIYLKLLMQVEAE